MRLTPSWQSAKSVQRGMSLIEVLVALLILTVGLLTMAALHASSLKLTKLNQFRTTASEVAQAFGDAVRSNTDGALAGAYTFVATGSAIVQPGNACNTALALACTPAEIAAVDVARGRTLASALPSGDLYSSLNAGAGNIAPTLSVWVYWSAPDVGPANEQAAWDSARELCPPAVRALAPTRYCLLYTIPL